jgi:hypothetical protein
MKNSYVSITLCFLIFVMGIGTGWTLSKKDGETPTNSPQTGSIEQLHSTNIPKNVSSNITLVRADELRTNFTKFSGPKPYNTEAVVHDLNSLKTFILEIEELFKDVTQEDIDELCKGCKPGVALYLGASYDGNYILEINKSYLLKDRYTVVALPVLFSETDPTSIHFEYVDAGDIIRPNERVEVKKIANFYSFIDHLQDLQNLKSKKNKFATKILAFFDDPQGFDLGHTNP